jgi:hypothetical protein
MTFPFKFNQTDLENLYLQNISDVTQIDSKLDLIRSDINNTNNYISEVMAYLLQDGSYKAIMDSTSMTNHNVQNASLDYQTRVNDFVALNRVILKSELICSSKPQGNNDWVMNILYIQK